MESYQETTGREPFTEHQSTVAENSLDDTPRRERSSTSSDVLAAEEKLKSTLDHKTGHTADPYNYMTPRLRSLVLWENPAHSAAVLGSSLALVLTCRWISLLNLFCGAMVFGISASFVYVNSLLIVSRITNKPDGVRPLDKYYSRSAEFLHLESERIHRRVDHLTDGLNVVLTELAKIILIQDNKRSLKFIGIFYAIWTLRTWFATTTLLATILVSLFAFPRLYLDNQTVIDAQLAKTNQLVQAHVGKGRQIVQEQWTNVSSKVETIARDRLSKKSDKKQE
ncbi:reticulon-like protein of the endoplasmic reticulum [Actinomortierella ambigua]|uniref:Reticulon-like protein n=1 Tax=Actinomortierella ambigua TaxID=1343610 RepID=A0A9P6PNK2_9FUNG|nr:reticulon-like protein of the endoplasmic reticulum [Actinomortierella ambigua]KAG0249145.1 reticulon-like protein of the endoplasmic reticulum [Actinomortierella ambigua]